MTCTVEQGVAMESPEGPLPLGGLSVCFNFPEEHFLPFKAY